MILLKYLWLKATTRLSEEQIVLVIYCTAFRKKLIAEYKSLYFSENRTFRQCAQMTNIENDLIEYREIMGVIQ